MLTIKRLRALLDYDPGTGVFRWRIYRNWKAPAGAVAGWLNDGGYRTIIVDGAEHKASRLAWAWHFGRWPRLHVDHENGKTDDNRIANLRNASRSQNIANSRLRKDNKAGMKGVCRAGKKWMAYVNKDGVRHYLGVFDTPAEAHVAYFSAARRLHGAFARAA